MKTFSTQVLIRATPEKIWSILTEASRYPEWNPTVSRAEGRIALGEKVTLHVTANPGRAFPVNVQTYEAPRRMIWKGGMPAGLFVGEREFTLTPQPDGTVEFAMRETFRGLLSPLIERSMPDLQPAFDEFAAALKREAERT